MKPRFYITTAIDYPNGSPHMGHAYEKVVTDSYARWYRLMGYDVHFLTGTDENGQKLVKAAAAQGKTTQAFVDEQVSLFKKLCLDLNISNDDFIRTTEPRHHEVCAQIWRKLEAQGDIHFDRYSGLYCLACEAFYTDTQAPEKRCPDHGTALEFVEEDGYFFKMSKYEAWIRDLLRAKPEAIFPSSARKEVMNRLEAEPLKDLSISRPNAGWGIPVPSNPKHVMYTWFDALINYLAAVSSGENHRFWPAQVHVIGKDIIWFHCVIWPIMLKAAGFDLPKQVYVHGMILAEDGRKMSKSLGNGVDPYDVIGKMPVDSFRYYLLRAISSGQDGRFSLTELRMRNNNELGNDYGNLLMRVVKLARKKLGDVIDGDGVRADFDFLGLGETMGTLMDQREHSKAIDSLWEAVNSINAYINDKAPWKREGSDPELKAIIYNSLYAIHCFGTLIWPFLPATGDLTLDVLGTKNAGLEGLRFGTHRFNLKDPAAPFPKIEAPVEETPGPSSKGHSTKTK